MQNVLDILQAINAWAYLGVAAMVVLFLMELARVRDGRAWVALVAVFVSLALTGLAIFVHYQIRVVYGDEPLETYRAAQSFIPILQFALLGWLNVETRRARRVPQKEDHV